MKIKLGALDDIMSEQHEGLPVEELHDAFELPKLVEEEPVHFLYELYGLTEEIPFHYLVIGQTDHDHQDNESKRREKDYLGDKHKASRSRLFLESGKRAILPIAIFSPNFWVALVMSSAMV